MERKTYINKLIIFIVVITLLVSITAFLGGTIRYDVSASSTHKVYFHHESYNSSLSAQSFEVNDGEDFNLALIPTIPANDGFYVYNWMYNEDDLKNITKDIHIYSISTINPDKKHTVTFMFPDGTSKTVQVVHGEDITDPPTSENLGFGEKDKYSVSLENIVSDMYVTVSVSKTTKYVVIALCGAVLIAGLTTIIIIVCTMLFKNDNTNNSDDGNKTSEVNNN